MTQHALIPISSLYRFFLCPGSFALSQGIEKKETEEAKRGTSIHNQLAEYFKGKYIEINDDNVFILDYINFIREKEDLFCKGEPERRVTITPNVWGTADYVIINPPYGVVIDYKSGVQFVEAINNPQLAGYAVGLAKEFSLSKVYTYIYQPSSSSLIKDWEMDITLLNLWHDKIKRLEDLLLNKKEIRYCAGEVQCQWCPAEHICPARVKQMNEIIEIQSSFPKPESLTPSQLSTVIKYKKLVSSFMDAVEDYIRDNDVNVPNVEKKEGARNRKWANEIEAAIRLENLGVEAKKQSLITVAQAEKLLGLDRFKQMEDLVSETRNKTRVIYNG